MTNKEKYKQAFSVLHASDHISLEVNNSMNKKKVFEPARRLVVACACVAITLGIGVTAYAAYHLLSSSQVATEIYPNSSLADAFEGENGIQINQKVECEGYVFSLLEITSGTGINKYLDENNNKFEQSESYAVIAIENADGTPMEVTSDDNYDMNNILVTPFIGGQEPWKVNIYNLDGGYAEISKDGIVYRIISCTDLYMFADRGVYIGICHELSDIKQGFYLNETSGDIARNEEFEGLNVLFKLPIDEAKADREKAEEILYKILNPTVEDISDEANMAGNIQDLSSSSDLDEWNRCLFQGMSEYDLLRLCHVIEGSEKIVAADENGVYKICGEGGYVREYIESEFVDYSGEIHVTGWSSGDTVDSLEISTYSYNKDKTVTFATYTPNMD